MKDLCGPRRIHLIVQRRLQSRCILQARRMSRRHRQSMCRPSRREPIPRHRLLRLRMVELHRAIHLHHPHRIRGAWVWRAGGGAGSCPRRHQWAVAEVHQRDDEARRAVVRERVANRQLERHLACADRPGSSCGDRPSFARSIVQAALAAGNPFLSGLPTDQQQALDRIFSNTGAGVGNFGAIIWVPIGFFIGMGILFVSAKIFGGTGSFLQQAYSFMLYYVPINGLGAILGLDPVLRWARWIRAVDLQHRPCGLRDDGEPATIWRTSGSGGVAASAIVALLVCALYLHHRGARSR